MIGVDAMAKSGLVSLKNATATFVVSGSSTSIDMETGNVIPSSESLTYKLYVVKSSQNDRANLPGTDTVQAEYTGNCVDPKITDSRLLPGVEGTLTPDGGTAVKCKIIDIGAPHGTGGLIGSVLANSIGTPIVIAVCGQG